MPMNFQEIVVSAMALQQPTLSFYVICLIIILRVSPFSPAMAGPVFGRSFDKGHHKLYVHAQQLAYSAN